MMICAIKISNIRQVKLTITIIIIIIIISFIQYYCFWAEWHGVA